MFGASSMGALRAAECASYGFVPLGAIAQWYANEMVDGDDEVAVLTHPQTHAPLTAPMVNVRYVARLAHRRGILSALERDAWIRDARSIFYMDRMWEDAIGVAPRHARAVLRHIAQREGDLKRWDAQFALRSVVRRRILPSPPASRSISPTLFTMAGYHARNTSPIVFPQSVPKAPGTYDRAISFSQTHSVFPELRRRYGITRVADTTLLDRTGIPTYSAMVPHSPDLLGVYNGKGLDRVSSIASAVMEATERQIGSAVRLPVFRETVRTVGQRIDLDACGMRDDARDLTVDCVLGTELLSGDAIPVPLAMVQCPWFGERLFETTSTNGLASGNNLTEAVYHALCELIERHNWAMYHVRCSLVPRMFLGPNARDIALAPQFRLPVGDAIIDGLIDEIEYAGLTVRALVLREEPLPVTVLASIIEPDSSPPMAHMGLGCALSPAHALTRALTEAVQSRVVDIQAAREDILRVGENAGVMGEHGRRLEALPTDCWYFDVPSETIELKDVADPTTADLALDLTSTLTAIANYGIENVIAVDLSPPDLPIAVVRMIVPGLETLMFSGRLGHRARSLLNPFATSP